MNDDTNSPTDSAVDSAAKPAFEIFSFDDTDTVMDRIDLLDYVQLLNNGKWYEPPIPYSSLRKAFNSSPHHSSAIYVKRNILASIFVPSKLLSVQDFSAFAFDFLTFGNGHLELRRSINRRPLSLRHSLAMYTRVGLDLDRFWFIHDYTNPHQFEKGSIFHLREPDLSQEVYGIPQYMSAMQSMLLSDASTIFRRRYYVNGSHAGFILYISDALHNSSDIESIKQGLRESRGKGNFKNFFIHAPNGKPDGVKVIPISEVASKDDFLSVKRTTRDEILAAHRVPPQLIGVIPENTGGFGKASEAAEVFVANELLPLQAVFMQLNEFVGETVIRFKPYAIGTAQPAA